MSNKTKVHAIVGTGTAPTAVIQEGLRDVIGKNDNVALLWLGPPNETMEDVYDFIMDNEIAFIMYYAEGANPARVFREAENGVVQKVRDPFKGALQSVANGGKVLFLWDNDAEDSQIEPVFDTIDQGTLVLELTNGCAPIGIEMDIPEPVDPDLAKDETEPDEDSDFTKEELEVMTPFAVKRYGERKGCAAKTKSGIIKELFPDGEASAPTEEDEGEVEPSSAVGAAVAPSSSTIVVPNIIDVKLDDPDEEFDEALAAFSKSLTDLLRLLYRS